MTVEGLLVVDKAAGATSHDVVATVRRLAGTRRVGHAGTLDPMATGVLLLGLGRATRLLGLLAGTDKDYQAVVRLGGTTSTDDADGAPLTRIPAGSLTVAELKAVLSTLSGAVSQIPPAYSAIKVGGRRAYARARAGEEVTLAARPVTVHRLALTGVRPSPVGVPGDLDVGLDITCSSGTYIRSLARDLGAALGVGGHLAALRRTRVGRFGLDGACRLDGGANRLAPLPLDRVVAACFPSRTVDAAAAERLRHGAALAAVGAGPGPVGVVGPGGELLALVEERDGAARPTVVFAAMAR